MMKRTLPAALCTTALLTGLGACLGTALAPLPALAQEAEENAAPDTPRPDAVTHDWSLEFTHSAPNTIAIEKADGSVDWYWYITYKVTNYTDDEVFFDPKIVIQNDAGKIIKSNLGIEEKVFNAVRKLVANPLLRSPLEMPGTVLKGEDYARRSAMIWKADKEDVDEFRVYIGGIFGEVKEVIDPTTGKPVMVPVIDALTGKPKTDASGDPLMQPLLARRTRMLHYRSPGTTINLQKPSVELVEQKDVMR